MNNWPIIVMPALALGGFAYGVWQRQMARHDAERAFEKKQTLLQEAYRELQVDHGVDLARADALQQDVERLTEERDDLTTAFHTVAKQRDELNRENEKLHARENLLIDAMNKQQPDEAPLPGVSSEFLNTLESHVEKGNVDEAPEIPVETTTVQSNPKPVRAKRRTTPTSN